jgi:N-methylhydantoinase A
MEKTMSVIVGIDVGGTFTDVVAVDMATGQHVYHKLPTTRENPANAALTGLSEIIALANASKSDLTGVLHGTTVGTNAILEKRYAETALVTTKGFKDVLELARQRRSHLWDLDVDKPDPVARRDRRFELDERLDGGGTVLRKPSLVDIDRVSRQVGEAKVRAVAMCLLHSYANSEHEIAVIEALTKAWPDLFVCASSQVVGEFGEYERFCSTVLNACLLPVMDKYLGDLEQGVYEMRENVPLRVMQSNGGIMSALSARRRPISTFLSGPAAGVVGAIPSAISVGVSNFITFDMGGTSTDVCLVERSQPTVRREQIVAGLPVKTPTVDIHTVGAGGGSVAWIDASSLLKVGPRSAGAEPGPACYGRGGTEPTVTDANMYLGRLNSCALLGGKMKVDYPAAERAIATAGRRLGLDSVRTAAGILTIVNANMVQAIRVISVERGHDPRDFALVAFGGAGPLHAADVAKELGIRRVIIPGRPGLLCALGLLHSPLRADFSRTRLVPLRADADTPINEVLAEVRSEFEAWRRDEGLEKENLHLAFVGDVRYEGQDFELQIPLQTSPLSSADLERLKLAFHEAHAEHYGYSSPHHPVEIVAVRLAVSGDPPVLPPVRAHSECVGALLEYRKMWFEETGWISAPVYLRDGLTAGERYQGPAVIEQMDSSTLVPPGMQSILWQTGELVLEAI